MMRLAALLCVLLSTASARDGWIRVRSAEFEVLTNSSEKTARQVLERCEQISGVFQNLMLAGRPPLPVRVVAFRSEQEYRRYRPGELAAAFYQSAGQRDLIVLDASLSAGGRVLFHEYVHLALNHFSVPLPRWLEEGTAEFYSTLAMGRSEVRIGRPIEEHLQLLLQDGGWLPAAQLAAITLDSPSYNERARSGVFYAQSWALTHMLHLGPGYREKWPRYLELLSKERSSTVAFERAFGKPLALALDDLRQYLRQPLPHHDFPARTRATPEVSVTPVSDMDAALLRAELFLDVGKRDEAAKLYREIARRLPESPEVAAGLAIDAMALRRLDQARVEFERALTLGARDAQTWFEYAMLLRETGAPRERVMETLERATAANPNFAEAHYLLGVRLSDSGRYAEAIEHLQQATRILPRQSPMWHALAYAQHKLGEREAAARSSLQALRTAATPQEQKMAEALENLQQAPADKPAVRTPEARRNAQADRRIEGKLSEIDCSGAFPRLIVEAGGKRVLLGVRNPGAVELRNAGAISFEFRCGPQHDRRVIVEFKSEKEDVTAIEFQ